MKKILFLLTILISGSAHADACSQRLTGSSFFNGSQSQLLCKVFGTTKVAGAAGSNYETLAGAGTTVTDAASLSATKFIHRITAADGTVGWKFTAVTGKELNQVHILLNTTAGVAKIYAPVGGTVNGGSVDAAFSALTGIKPIVCVFTGIITMICA